MIRIGVRTQDQIEDPNFNGRAFTFQFANGQMIGCKSVIVNTPMKIIYDIDEKFGEQKIVWANSEDATPIQEDFYPENDVVTKPTIIHINRNVIQRNAKHSLEEPVCRVEKDGKVRYCMEVQINGPSHMIYSPNKPRPCGAKLWIETYADVELIGEKV